MTFGFDCLQRGGMAYRGIYANTSDETMAAAAVFDADAMPLTGASSYSIHMARDPLPKTGLRQFKLEKYEVAA